MILETRVLPPDEWGRLVGMECETVVPHLRPGRDQVVVVERDGVIVGSWVLLWVLHAECVWVAPAVRGSRGVVRRLLEGMRAAARSLGVARVATAAQSDDVRRILDHLHAERLCGDHYMLDVTRSVPTRRENRAILPPMP